MADAVTAQLIANGPRNWGYVFTNLSDGTGESDVVKVDGSAAGPLGVFLQGQHFYPLSHIKITEIEYDVKGMALEIIWDATTSQNALVLEATLRASRSSMSSAVWLQWMPPVFLWSARRARSSSPRSGRCRTPAIRFICAAPRGFRRARMMPMKSHLRNVLAAALLFGAGPALAQQTNYLGTVFVADFTTPTYQLKINSDGSINVDGSFSATLAGFTPSGNYSSPLSVSNSSSRVALPSGSPTTVAVYNTGSQAAFCKLGNSSVTGPPATIFFPATVRSV